MKCISTFTFCRSTTSTSDMQILASICPVFTQYDPVMSLEVISVTSLWTIISEINQLKWYSIRKNIIVNFQGIPPQTPPTGVNNMRNRPNSISCASVDPAHQQSLHKLILQSPVQINFEPDFCAPAARILLSLLWTIILKINQLKWYSINKNTWH